MKIGEIGSSLDEWVHHLGGGIKMNFLGFGRRSVFGRKALQVGTRACLWLG